MSVSTNILDTDYDIATTTYIDLYDNHITDIPDAISSLANLQRLFYLTIIL